ncbi:unnamed protein product, partial [Mesorhabditis belari]|uniref:Uncharacterized protein n=1 Tax=Mesorhabditis belari TaxID=2138241 RepID=A0AAF3EHS6_9BILA
MILQTVSATMPKDKKLPRIGVFILAEMVLTAVAVLITCFFMLLHERAFTYKWNPPKIMKICLLCRTYDRKVKQRTISQQYEDRQSSLSVYIDSINNFLKTIRSDECLEAQWTRIFDRLDIISMVFFQVLNIVLTCVILFR